MKVSLISYTPNAERLLVFTKNTRLGVNSERLADLDSKTDAELLEQLKYMANTIPSSWEFVDYVFLVEGVSRAYTHQQVRTRTASFAQESLRVVDKGRFGFVYPERMMDKPDQLDSINYTLDTIQDAYNYLTKTAGAATEDARSILPTNIATNIVCKFNLRTMSELAASRSGGRTQGEYRDVVKGMIDEVLKVHPWASLFFFGDRHRDYFDEIEKFAEDKFGGDLIAKGELLKIVDKMRKGR